MTQPAKRHRTDQIAHHVRRQGWILLGVIVGAWVLDSLWLHSDGLIVQGVALGASLSFVTQMVFTVMVFRRSGYRARQHIVKQLYRGQALKWLLTAAGFASIFIGIQPLSAPAVFAGFILMQMSFNWLMIQMS